MSCGESRHNLRLRDRGEVDLFTPEYVVPGNVPLIQVYQEGIIRTSTDPELDRVGPPRPTPKFGKDPIDDSDTKRLD